MNTLSTPTNGLSEPSHLARTSSPASSTGVPSPPHPSGATSSERSSSASCSSLQTSDLRLQASPTPSSLFHPGHVEPWPDPVDGCLLLDEFAGLLSRFVVLPSHAAETLALWTLHTYAFELRDVTTYIGLVSPEKRCGKTTLLGVLSELVHRPVDRTVGSPRRDDRRVGSPRRGDRMWRSTVGSLIWPSSMTDRQQRDVPLNRETLNHRRLDEPA